MPVDLKPFLEPERCAVIVFECQENVIGSGSRIHGLARAVRESGMLANIAGLLAEARRAGVRVFYCTAEHRAGGLGRAVTPLTDRMERVPDPEGDVDDASIVEEIAPQADDVRIPRGHGMSAFHQTGLDPCLRDLGTRTVIVVGVSVNIGIMATTIEAINHGYRAIVPADCVAGDPPEYAEQALRYSIRNLAYVTTSQEIARVWQALERAG